MRFKLVRFAPKYVFTVNAACLLIALIGGSLAAQAKQSFFGITGLSFIPTADILPPGALALSYSGNPGVGDDVNLIPYSVHWGSRPRAFLGGRVEIAGTNTYLYASAALDTPANVGVNVKNVGIPIIPSFKYQIVAMDPSTNNSAMAFGITTPYGAFYVYDKYLRLRFLKVTLHTGIATKLITYHFFTGATVHFGSQGPDYTHSLPFRFIFEGSWGGSLKNLQEKEESFWAITSVYQWTNNLTLEAFVRFDGAYGPNDPLKRMGIGLGYILGGT